MKKLLILIGVQAVSLLMAAHIWAGYKVTKVIEIGPAVPLLTGGALKWSPDGTMLAYFANNYLMVSDTLGNSRQVAALQSGLYPLRAEWASGTEFAVCLEDRGRRDSVLNRMVVYDIRTGRERVLEEYWRTRWSHLAGHTQFTGPYLTTEGKAYYTRTVITGLMEGDPAAVLRSREFHVEKLPLSSSAAAAQDLESSHLQVWGKDGLYSVNWAGGDSTHLWQNSGPAALRMWTAVSSDGSYIFNDGKLYTRETSEVLDVAAYTGALPDSTQGCDFGSPSFNPRGDELLFMHTCEGGESYVVDRIGLFNYASRQFVLLDTLIGIPGGSSPVYSPSGRMIAFLSHNRAYLVWREEADVDQSGGSDPTLDDITLGDCMYLQDYLFVTGPSLGLPDCY